MRARRPLLAVPLAFALALPACGGDETPPATAAGPEAAPVPVASAPVLRESIVEPVLGTGTIAAHKTTDVGPRVSGIVDAIHVAVGDRVEAGDPLFRTRTVDYEIRVREAESALRLARANAQKAERDFERIRTLHGQRVASDERLDAVRTAFEMAAAQRDQAEAALAQARQNLADTTVRAPYRGVITHRFVDEGAMLSTMMTMGNAVVQIMKVDRVVAIVSLPELHLARVHVGTPGAVRVAGIEREYPAAVDVLNDRVDPVSRAFEVRLGIENPDYALKPGLFAELELRPEAREATLVERAALLGGEGASYVFVLADGRAARRPVRVRELDARRVEVLEGLAPGERVLLGPNLTQLADGSAVAVEVTHADR
jgi:RND family efflux transporter MFP subunit